MAQTAPSTIPALPTPPSTASPANFDSLGDAFLGALPANAAAINAASTVTYNNAVDAYNNAVAVAANALAVALNTAAVASYANAVAWVSGTTYAIGDVRYAPANRQIYRRITAGAGTTDPSLDATNWAPVFSQAAQNLYLYSILGGL